MFLIIKIYLVKCWWFSSLFLNYLLEDITWIIRPYIKKKKCICIIIYWKLKDHFTLKYIFRVGDFKIEQSYHNLINFTTFPQFWISRNKKISAVINLSVNSDLSGLLNYKFKLYFNHVFIRPELFHDIIDNLTIKSYENFTNNDNHNSKMKYQIIHHVLTDILPLFYWITHRMCRSVTINITQF